MKLINEEVFVEIKVLKKNKIRVAYNYVTVSMEISTGLEEQ
jgi:hypothetical protein